MKYQFKKWFFDLNADEESYVYFILVEIQFFFFKIRNFTFHYFHYPDGSLTISRNIRLTLHKKGWDNLDIKGKELNINHIKKNLTITSDFNDLKINLTYNPFHKEYLCEGLLIPHKKKRISWFPLTEFMTASGTIEINKKLLRIEKVPAYIDNVYSDILPMNTPVLKMFWGRLMQPDIMLTYSIVFTPEGNQHSTCIVMMNQQQFTFTDIHYHKIKGLPDGQEDDTDENIYQLTVKNGISTLSIFIYHRNTAAFGAFIDPEQYKFKSAFNLLNKVSKNPRGKKFISQADIILDLPGYHYKKEKLIFIDEYVVF
jgi:hypothetical protein